MNRSRPSSGHVARLAGVAAILGAAVLAVHPGCKYDVTLGYGGNGMGGTFTGTLTDGRTNVGTCPGVPCGAGQACCYLDGSCFDPQTQPSACVATQAMVEALPPFMQQLVAGDTVCGSDVDCAAGEYCAAVDGYLCLGVGHCLARNDTNCGLPNPQEVIANAWCGCDSVSYADYRDACMAGVRVMQGNGACGHAYASTGEGDASSAPFPNPTSGIPGVLCGTAGSCPEPGQTCCSITGRCQDAAKPCTFPPAGYDYPCEVNLDCPYGRLCNADTCTGPGGCVYIDYPLNQDKCGVELIPSCGCDGKNYTSPACAFKEGSRVAHDGTCN
jgi:hypothetical protein